jgi:hypothetical protein
MWSKSYRSKYRNAWEEQARDLYTALKRNDGLFSLYRAAHFVDQHRAQGNRLDFGRIFDAYSGKIPFVVGGSDEDPFEHRQMTFAEQRLSMEDSRSYACLAVTSRRTSVRKPSPVSSAILPLRSGRRFEALGDSRL